MDHEDIGLGVVVAVFSGVGFECATAFGEEAKKPLITIPRAVIASLLADRRVLHLHHLCRNARAGQQQSHARSAPAPLTTLSENLGVGWMGVVIEFGAMISFFALAMSCLNAGSASLHDGPIWHLPDLHRQLAQAQSDAARRDHHVCDHPVPDPTVFMLLSYMGGNGAPTRCRSAPRSMSSTMPASSAPWVSAAAMC
jgi:hypothetical protein